MQAGAVVWFYLAKALAPIKLIFFYPQWNIQTGNLLWWLPLLAAIVVTVVLVWRRKSPQADWFRPLLFAWAFFCVALAPAMGFFDPGYMRFSLVADHYQHLALLAVVSLLGAGISIWHDRVRSCTAIVCRAGHGRSGRHVYFSDLAAKSASTTAISTCTKPR